MKRTILIITIPLLVFLIFSGCSGPKSVFLEFANAIKNKDAEKSWGLLCTDNKKFLNQEDNNKERVTLFGRKESDNIDGKTIWTNAISGSTSDELNLSGRFANIEVLDYTVSGENSEMTFSSDGVQGFVKMVQEDGTWKVVLPESDLRIIIGGSSGAAFDEFTAAINTRDGEKSWNMLRKSSQDRITQLFINMRSFAASNPVFTRYLGNATDGKSYWIDSLRYSEIIGLPNMTSEFKDMVVVKEDNNVDNAHLTVRKTQSYSMVKEGGSWKVDLSPLLSY